MGFLMAASYVEEYYMCDSTHVYECCLMLYLPTSPRQNRSGHPISQRWIYVPAQPTLSGPFDFLQSGLDVDIARAKRAA